MANAADTANTPAIRQMPARIGCCFDWGASLFVGDRSTGWFVCDLVVQVCWALSLSLSLCLSLSVCLFVSLCLSLAHALSPKRWTSTDTT